MMDPEVFQSLSEHEMAELVRSSGPKVCVFPINGTRRWFMLEHTVPEGADSARVYCDVAAERHIDLYRMLFDHGFDTLLTPIFGPDLIERGDDYARMAIEGLVWLATDRRFLAFYRDRDVRVRFYGDHRRFLAPRGYGYVSDLFDEAAAQTAAHDRHRLFFGVCAHEATETIAQLAVQYHSEHGRIPDKKTLVEMYYGEQVQPVSLFIGFDKPCVFDMPLVATGNEDLYFTVSPSPYLSRRQLRAILYDHLYSRRGDDADYASLDAEEWRTMGEFYRANLDNTLGVGARAGNVWYPLPQVALPTHLQSLASAVEEERD
jgi:tuberculosinol/isotuberculosinol synthase